MTPTRRQVCLLSTLMIARAVSASTNTTASTSSCDGDATCLAKGSLHMADALMQRTKSLKSTLDSTRAVCTGNAELDDLLERANLADAAGLTSAGSVYTWEGFCSALRIAKSVGVNFF